MPLPSFNEVLLDTPVEFTPAAAATPGPLFKQPYKWVTSIVIRMRSKGTCTYCAVGNEVAQKYQLIGIGGIYQFACNPGEVLDAAKIWILSDTNDAVLEVVCSYLPIALYGNVNLAIGQR